MSKTAIHVQVPTELKEWLDEHCRDNGHTQGWVITKLLEKFQRDKMIQVCPDCGSLAVLVDGHGVCEGCVDAAYDHVGGGGINRRVTHKEVKS